MSLDRFELVLLYVLCNGLVTCPQCIPACHLMHCGIGSRSCDPD
uniref:Uncharacterized protein n=1 Tax=Anguilla anguilla TaxID=7936 RepID=A0A0E9XXH4_ANGAN